MTKKILSALIIAIAIKSTGLIHAKKAASDSSMERKNEIEIGISPVLLLYGGKNMNQTYSIGYRRHINTHWSVRASTNIITKNNWRQDLSSGFYKTIYMDDTSMILRSRQNRWSPEYRLRTGTEYSYGKKKLKCIMGIDLFAGYCKRTSTLLDVLLIKDTSNYLIPRENSMTSDYSLNEFSFGCTPFFGIKYPVSNRVMLSAQTSINAYAQLAQYRHSAEGSFTYVSYIFEANPLFHNVSLRYLL